jgi:chaperonin cofactor prefoldin
MSDPIGEFLTKLEGGLNEAFEEKKIETSKFVKSLKNPKTEAFVNNLISNLSKYTKGDKMDSKSLIDTVKTTATQTLDKLKPKTSILSSIGDFFNMNKREKRNAEGQDDAELYDKKWNATERLDSIFNSIKGEKVLSSQQIKERISQIDKILDGLCDIEIKIDGKSEFYDIYGKKLENKDGKCKSSGEANKSISDIDFNSLLNMSEDQRNKYVQSFIDKINENGEFKDAIVKILLLLNDKLHRMGVNTNKDYDILAGIIKQILEKILDSPSLNQEGEGENKGKGEEKEKEEEIMKQINSLPPNQIPGFVENLITYLENIMNNP